MESTTHMRRQGQSKAWLSHRWPGAVALLLFIGLLWLYSSGVAPTVTARHGGIDGGELTVAALTGAVAHPPGYPGYILLARLAVLPHVGEPAWRLGMLSAVCMAAAAATLALVAAQLIAGSSALRLGGALYVGLALGTDSLAWSQALIAEVYAPAALVLALLIGLAVRWQRHGTALVALGLLIGLSYGFHQTLLMVLPAGMLALWAGGRRPTRRQLVGALAAALGLVPFALLPWQAAQYGGWGDLQSLQGFATHVLGLEYSALLGAPSWAERLGRLSAVARGLLHAQGVWGLILGCVGLTTSGGRRALIAFTGALALISLLWTLAYGGENSQAYVLPLHVCWALWSGLGLAQVASIRRWLLPLALLPLLVLPDRAAALSLRTATADRDHALQLLEDLPPASILLTVRDEETFALWYVQRALGRRPDVQVVDMRLWSRAWYRRQHDGDPDVQRWLAGQEMVFATPQARDVLPGSWVTHGRLWHYSTP